jgi:predicted cobalt transporter CbtA
MKKRIVLWGMLAGGIAGLLAFVFARIFAEPYIQKAIDYESGRDAAQAALDRAAGLVVPSGDADIFSRTIQADVGLGVGMIAFGIALGAVVAVVYCLYVGRVGNLGHRSLALGVAGGGFLGLYLVPFLKYPANPPAIGHADTIQERSLLYLVMVLCSILFLIGAVWLGQRLRERLGNWNATLVAGAAFIAASGILMGLLPSLGDLASNRAHFGPFGTETPQPLRNPAGQIVYPGFPADVLFKFRLLSLGAQLILWGVLGVCFAPLAQRVLQPAGRRLRGSKASAAPYAG